MKRMCAWCGMELDQGKRWDNQPLTHGLCPACRKRYFPPAKEIQPDVVGKDRHKGRAEQPKQLSS